MDADELRQLRELQRIEAGLARVRTRSKYGFQPSAENDIRRAEDDEFVARSDSKATYAVDVTVAILRQLFSQHTLYTWVADPDTGEASKLSKINIRSSLGNPQSNLNERAPELYVTANSAATQPIALANLAHWDFRTDTKLYSGLSPVSVSIRTTATNESQALWLADFIETSLTVTWDLWCRGRWHSISNVSVLSDPRNRVGVAGRSAPHTAYVNFVAIHQWMSRVAPAPNTYFPAGNAHVLTSDEGPGIDGRVDPAISANEDLFSLYAVPDYPTD